MMKKISTGPSRLDKINRLRKISGNQVRIAWFISRYGKASGTDKRISRLPMPLLAKGLGMGEATLRRSLASLKKIGILEVETTKFAKGDGHNVLIIKGKVIDKLFKEQENVFNNCILSYLHDNPTEYNPKSKDHALDDIPSA